MPRIAHADTAMNRALTLLLLTLPCAFGCAGQKYRVDVGPFFARATGDIALQNSAGSLSLGQNQNDLDRNFGLSDTEPSPYVRVQMDKDRHRVRVHGFGVDGDGSGVLAGDYGDIPAGSSVTTSMEFYSIAANWAYQLLRGENYRFAAGAQAGYYSLDVAARSPAGREEVETDVLVPMPFFELEGFYKSLTLGANVALMSADLGDASGRYLDAEAYLRWSAAKDFDFFVGYRYVVLDAYGRATDRDFDADIDVEGLFFGAGIRF
jgi:hypothetical protein